MVTAARADRFPWIVASLVDYSKQTYTPKEMVIVLDDPAPADRQRLEVHLAGSGLQRVGWCSPHGSSPWKGGPAIVASLEKWAERGIIKFMPRDRRRPPGPHALVIEPHMDDAIVSLGGRLINQSGRQRTTILSLTRWSSYTSYLLSGRTDFTDVEIVTRLRLAESEIAARMCGATFVAMN
jgi:hypothetical protein